MRAGEAAADSLELERNSMSFSARAPSLEALTPVAEFFAHRNFTVPSRSHVADLELRADDGPFVD
jgi:hypothetical protein